jgi:aconitase B
VLDAYREHEAERAAQGIPAKPLNAEQVAAWSSCSRRRPPAKRQFLLVLLSDRVPPGVDEAAYVKAGFLSAIAKGETDCALISREDAVKLLGNMHGGYNIETLVGLLEGRRPRRGRRLGAQAHAADVRGLPRRGGAGQGRQRPRQRSCRAGPTASGSPTARGARERSRWRCSR